MEKSAAPIHFQLTVFGKAHMSVKNCTGGVVSFRFDAADGSAVTSGQVVGDRELIDCAWRAGRATLAMLGKTFQVKVTSKLSIYSYVTIDSASFLRALIPLAKPAR